jgi:TolB-like protein/DNA-binding winged helix-turn-helix (wHTH) protein/lipoprotein NlpI
MNSFPLQRVRFGAFELDLRTGELCSIEAPDSNQKALLREQLFQLLRMLVECEGKIVTREEIRNRLWGNDTIVDFDQGINSTIKALRRALGDSADNPRYIETLGRRGYRLMLTVEYPESTTGTVLEKDREKSEQPAAEISENAARVEPQIKPRRWKAAVVLGCAVILVGVGYTSWRRFGAITPLKSERIMLAVLPFQNLTGDPNKEYLADGLTEETISQLSRVNPDRLGVISRTSVMGYKHKDERLDQIGRDLSVQYVLENSLRGSADQLRLTSQLIQVRDQTHLWSQEYNYPAKDILNIEEDVAKAVTREIQVRLTSKQQIDLAQSQPVSPEAWDAYLQGYFFFERNTDKDTDMAAKYYERATQLDPSYALAWVGLSRARKWQAVRGLIPKEEGYRIARKAVERALVLNPNLAAAHAQMGRIKQQVDFDWTGADASFQQAAALEPGNPEAVRSAAASARMLGRFDEALRLTRRAVSLDPLNAHSWQALGDTEYYAGQLDAAAADFQKALELNPDVFPGNISLSRTYIIQERAQDALSEIELVRYDDARATLYPLAYYALGRKKEADAALSELISKYHASTAYQIAEVYAFRNQSDEAFEWLDRAYVQRDDDLVITKVDPLLKNLHSDPRYTAFLDKIHLPAI